MKTTKKMITAAAGLMAAAIAVSAGAMSVSADTYYTALDTQFLNNMGVCPDQWGSMYTGLNWTEVSQW